MKNTLLSIFACSFLIFAQPASFAQANTNSFPQHHANIPCSQCHQNTKAIQAPTEQTCIQCHGQSSSIKLPANVNEKNYHNSPHYGDTVGCLECHREHKPHQNLCQNCHVIK